MMDIRKRFGASIKTDYNPGDTMLPTLITNRVDHGIQYPKLRIVREIVTNTWIVPITDEDRRYITIDQDKEQYNLYIRIYNSLVAQGR